MIDIHCHIVPSIDDGAKDLETSVEMLKIAKEDGIRKIIATPHFYMEGSFENKYEDVSKKVEELNIEAKKRNIDIEILPGQEVFLDKHTLEYYKRGIIQPLHKTKYMLLEFHGGEFPKHALDTIYELKILGIKTIIAHPERYPYFFNDNLTLLNNFISEGCLFQVTAGSILGIYGKECKKSAKKLIENNVCDFIASDAHGTGRRKPVLSECCKLLKNNNEQLYKRVTANASRLVGGQDIEVVHRKIEVKKGFFSRVFGRRK
ncbi:tyrosine-protein phosphatase [Haloimpatiens sp. FM7330]|uniref:tyrosine-protein phosphatase n=1 Tax=Haloimpatiens sp. FM7330 TaxID=3298610 RepID=UPI003629271C